MEEDFSFWSWSEAAQPLHMHTNSFAEKWKSVSRGTRQAFQKEDLVWMTKVILTFKSTRVESLSYAWDLDIFYWDIWSTFLSFNFFSLHSLLACFSSAQWLEQIVVQSLHQPPPSSQLVPSWPKKLKPTRIHRIASNMPLRTSRLVTARASTRHGTVIKSLDKWVKSLCDKFSWARATSGREFSLDKNKREKM